MMFGCVRTIPSECVALYASHNFVWPLPVPSPFNVSYSTYKNRASPAVTRYAQNQSRSVGPNKYFHARSVHSNTLLGPFDVATARQSASCRRRSSTCFVASSGSSPRAAAASSSSHARRRICAKRQLLQVSKRIHQAAPNASPLPF